MDEFSIFEEDDEEFDDEELRILDFLYFFDGVLGVESYCKRYNLDTFEFARAIKMIKIEVNSAKRS